MAFCPTAEFQTNIGRAGYCPERGAGREKQQVGAGRASGTQQMLQTQENYWNEEFLLMSSFFQSALC